ncbi:hypothetical protein TNCV_2524751 [Trichonephila clavipes]|nr:hypothetical protein TNCV_2524751 [Trichonephila clavipes]
MHKDRFSVDFVTSKSRVAPLKELSLPILGQIYALLAAHLAQGKLSRYPYQRNQYGRSFMKLQVMEWILVSASNRLPDQRT